VVALGEIAAEGGEEVEGGAFFYSFGDDFQSEGVREFDGRAYEGEVARAARGCDS
jgi:hypothetical protein